MKWLLLIFAIIAIFSATFVLLYWSRYSQTAERQWAQRVLRHRNQLRTRFERADRGPPEAEDKETLRQDYFARYLETISFRKVLGYPGIGPGTVSRLEEWNFRHLGEMVGYDFMRLPGFGPVKSQEMTYAVTQLLNEAKSTFRAGACREAQEFQRELAKRQARREALAKQLAAEAKALRQALRSMDDLVSLAEQVSFLKFLQGESAAGLDELLMGRGLPEVPDPFPREDLGPGRSEEPARRPPSPRDAAPPVAVLLPPVTPTSVPPAIPTARPLPAPASGTGVIVASAPATTTGTTSNRPPQDLFQEALQNTGSTSAPPPPHPGRARLTALAQLYLWMAKADGRIAKAELTTIRELLTSEFGHDEVLTRFIDPTLEQYQKSTLEEGPIVAAIQAVMLPVDRTRLLQRLETVADASGERNEREIACLTRIQERLELTATELPRSWPTSVSPASVPKSVPKSVPASDPARSPAGSSTESPTVSMSIPPEPDPRVVLEIDPAHELTVDLIRRRYLQLWEQTDPKQAARLGVEFEALAQAKRERIRRAAETLMAPFGEPLDPPPAPPPSADMRDNPLLDDIFGA